MPNSICDLHLHTHYSDGSASPSEILHHAASIGLVTVAITDHDNLNADREAQNVAGQLGLELIPGIEFTSRWDQCSATNQKNGFVHDVDILGYFFDRESLEFQTFVQGAFDDLYQRIVECCELLTAAGHPITIYDVLDENPRYPGALQLISALWHKDHAFSWSESYSLFVEHWPRVRPSNYSTEQVLSALHQAGGVAILAHPVAIQSNAGWITGAQVAGLVQAGLDGLEIYHPRLDAAARAHFLTIARQFNLLVTGGSDEHGAGGKLSRMGSQLITYEMVNALRQRAETYQMR